MKNFFKHLTKVLTTTTLVSLLIISPVSAISSSKLSTFGQGNILFYDPDACSSFNVSGDQITWIGDSYTVGAQSLIEETFPDVDIYAQVSKHFAADIEGNKSGLTILKELSSSNSLRGYIVFALGTNDLGSNISGAVSEIISLIGTSRTIVFVTARTQTNDYDSSINNTLISAAASHSNVLIADWSLRAEQNLDTLFTSDGIHPNNDGYEAWVATIKSTLPSSSNSGSISVGDNKDYEGNQIISDEQLEKISEYQPLYEAAANKVGIPWTMLAAIHIKESSLSRTNPNEDGIFQILALAVESGHENSDAEFIEQATLAAQYLKNSLGDETGDDAVKRAFFAYNGRASSYISQARDLGFSEEEANNGEGSPYVMNRADKQRDPNYNTTTWGQIKVDHGSITYPANQDYGAFVYYIALGGGNGSSVCRSGAGNMDLNQTAIDLAWPLDDPHNTRNGAINGSTYAKTASNPYAAALEEVGLTTYGDANVQIGASCDAFVTTVVRYSGVDENFYCCGCSSQIGYLTGEGAEKFEEITYSNPNDTSFLKPGDILIIEGHIKMYIEIDGQGMEAQASYGDHSGQISNGVSLVDSLGRGNYRVFRAK